MSIDDKQIDRNNRNFKDRFWMPYNFTLCRDNGNTLTTEKAWTLTDPNFNYIVLCPTALSGIPSLRQNEDRGKDFTLLLTANAEILMQYISATLFHMILHVIFRLQSESIILSSLFFLIN